MSAKTYVFAGASSKTAIETARQLQAQGHQVIGISTKKENPVYNAFHRVESYDFNAFPVIEEKISGLVYFPGTINLKPFKQLGKKDFERDFSINSLGAAAFVQAYLQQLKKGEHPSIVFISTVAAGLGMPFHASVAMAKAALEGLSRALAAELAPGIRVNCVAPSLSDTPLAEKFISNAEKREAAEQRNPMRKIGEAADLAHAIAFLLSPQAAWITGQSLAVDGGMNNLKLL